MAISIEKKEATESLPIQKVALEEMQPEKLKKLPETELRLAWLRLHQWFGAARENKQAIENIVNAAHWVIREFERRGMNHETESELAQQAAHLLKKTIEDQFEQLPEDVLVVKNFVSLVGSVAKAKQNPGDIDILFRARRSNEEDFLIQAENIWLPLRKILDPEKGLDLHFIDNPQGPHDDHVPIYDLILRRHPQFKRQVMKADDFVAPDKVAQTAKQGLMERDQWQRGGLSVAEAQRQKISSGVTTAKKLSEKKPLSVDEIKQIKAFLDRHERNYQPDKKMNDGGPTAGTIAYRLWGGPAAREWVASLLEEIVKTQPTLGDVHIPSTDWEDDKKKTEKETVKPIQKYEPQKPLMLGYTDFANLDELWKNWAKDRIDPDGLLVSPKVDGFRTIIQKAGQRISIFFEDAKQERADELPQLVEALKKSDKDFIIEGELQAHVHHHYVARPQLLSFIAGKLEAHPVVFLYDLLYDQSDLHAAPFTQRLAALQALHLASDYFNVLPQKKVTTQAELENVGKQLAHWQPQAGQSLAIEGIVVRQPTMPYVFGPTDLYVKTKKYVELKFLVTAVNRKENGYTYDIALDKDGQPFAMGSTFVSKEKLANQGDIINVQVEEILLQPDGTVDLGKPTPLGPDKSRSAPYTIAQTIDLAKRFGVLKEIIAPKAITQAVGEEGDTHASLAEKFWKDNWDKVYPPSGHGQFIFQHHWRGLPQEQKDADEKTLMQTNHSVHGDLRLSGDGELWGFTVFIGTVAENRQVGGDRLIALTSKDNPLRGTFKLAQPNEWLKVGLDHPFISEPGGVGATSKKWSKFFAEDHGTYDMGVRNRSFAEFFLHGNKLKGRYIIQNVPIDGNRVRAWMISKPEDQTPFAETHHLQEEMARLKKRGHKKLIWAKPGEKPQIIDLTKTPTVKSFEVLICKRDAEKQLITGIVLEPNTTDAHGDWEKPEEIEQAAHKFMLRSRIIGLQHKEPGPVEVVESYIAPNDMRIGGQKVVKGSWIMTVKVHDKKIWNKVKAGDYTGFSVGGMAIRSAA